MRTALLSDVHGNAVALDAVVADLERRPVDAVVCLGDMLQGGAQPAQVAARLARHGWPVVLGNADAFLLDADAGSEVPTPAQLEVRAWTREALGEQGLALIEAFRPTVEADLGDGRRLLAFHGSPQSYDDFLLPVLSEGVFRTVIGSAAADVYAGGHVHLQFLRRIGRSVFVNPGSVGFSYDHEQPDDGFRLDPWAAYAVVETDGDTIGVAFRRVPFDPGAVVAALQASGVPNAERAIAMWGGAP